MAWNYQGYGETMGEPSPSNIKSDGEAILNFLLNDLNMKG